MLDFRIDRRFEVRGKPEQALVPGRKLKRISEFPTYTDLDTLDVPVPAGFAPSLPVTLVLAGSIAEEQCPGCEAGRRDCVPCKGSGTQDCPQTVKCPGCGGGADACWSCAGTRKKGYRKPPAKARSKPRTDWCRLCGEHDVACPKCFGEKTKVCRLCKGTGHKSCDTCGGRKRVEHKLCAASGYLTTFTKVVVDHPVEPDPKQIPAPLHLRWPTRRAGWRWETLTDVTDKLPADLPETLRTEVEPLLTFAKGEVAREVTLGHLPVARVTVESDPEWVYFAFPERPETDGGLKVVRRPARQRVVRLAAIASAAVVIAVLVTWLVMKAIG